MASISYAILVCNEHRELDRLLSLLVPFIGPEDEIIVQVDKDKYTSEVMDVLKNYSGLSVCFEKFTGNFADWRNLLSSHCSKDWIFQIDADEIVPLNLILHASQITGQVQETIDAIAVPRVNTVLGLTQEDIEKWHWNVTTEGIVNWPDYQVRLFRNNGNCKYVGAVHEHLDREKTTVAVLPADPIMALLHPKTIERQRRQNALYDTYQQ